MPAVSRVFALAAIQTRASSWGFGARSAGSNSRIRETTREPRLLRSRRCERYPRGNMANDEGETPLMAAEKHGHNEIVRMLR